MVDDRSVNDIINELMGVIPETESEFLGALENLYQEYSIPTEKNKLYRREQIRNVCKHYIDGTENWHFNALSVLVRQPINVTIQKQMNELHREHP